MCWFSGDDDRIRTVPSALRVGPLFASIIAHVSDACDLFSIRAGTWCAVRNECPFLLRIFSSLYLSHSIFLFPTSVLLILASLSLDTKASAAGIVLWTSCCFVMSRRWQACLPSRELLCSVWLLLLRQPDSMRTTRRLNSLLNHLAHRRVNDGVRPFVVRACMLAFLLGVCVRAGVSV